MNLEEFYQGPVRRLREALRQRQSIWGPFPIPNEILSNDGQLVEESGLETGEASVTSEETSTEVPEACDNSNGSSDGVALGTDNNGKGNGEDGSFFDCNICLDVVRNPVVTCCGHLFCWPCLYRWLYVHSDAKECPVCKGEVTIKTVTPIYGRGKVLRVPEEDLSLKIPLRPPSQRVESWRETIERAAAGFPLEEMMRRMSIRFGMIHDLAQVQPQNSNDPLQSLESPERRNWMLNRILTTNGMRREQNTFVPADFLVGLTPTIPTDAEAEENHQPTMSDFISGLFSDLDIRNDQEQPPADEVRDSVPPAGDVRDSVSNIASAIQSDRQLVDAAVAVESTSISTHSYRTRNNASRVSNAGSGDSRAHRRRRLN